jgi:CRP-like cAMP-binding protein
MPEPRAQPPAALDALLGRAPIFSSLTDRQLRSLARTVKVVSFPAKAPIVKQGEPGIALYILLRGEAEVRQGNRTLGRLGPGQFFGEMTLLDEQPRSADVVAVQPTECAVLSRWEFWGFAKGEPEVLQGIGREMARRLREADRALSE